MTNDFKTQQEIWKWLAEGGEVVHLKYTGIRIKFINGELIKHPGLTDSGRTFPNPKDWQKVIPKKTVTLRMYMEGNTGVWLKDGMDTYPMTPYKPTNWTKEIEILEDNE